MTVPASGWRRVDDDLGWFAWHPVAGTTGWEIEVDGDEAGPDRDLLAVVGETLPIAGELVEAGARHLRHVTSFGPEAPWYPEGARCTVEPGDGHREPRLILHFSLEEDGYALWAVTLRRSGSQWCIESCRRTQD